MIFTDTKRELQGSRAPGKAHVQPQVPSGIYLVTVE